MQQGRWSRWLVVVGVLVAGCGGDDGLTSTGARPVNGSRSSDAVHLPTVAPRPPEKLLPTSSTAPPTNSPNPVTTSTQSPEPADSPLADITLGSEPTEPTEIADPPVEPPLDDEPLSEDGGPTPIVPPAFYAVPAVAPDAAAGAFGEFDRLVGQATIGRGALTLGIAIAYNGEIVHEAAYGLEDARSGLLPSAVSRFRIASISKVFTATLIMQLVEQGLVSLDETALASIGVPLGDQRIANVSVRQLLSHTSGFPKAQALYFQGAASSWQDASYQALGSPLEFDPGTLFRYSNTNYALLGLLIEQRTGLGYEQAIRDRILAPLGISTMRLAGTFDVQSGDVYHPSTPGRNYMEALGPAGQWIASPADVLRLILALGSASLVSQASVDVMRTAVPAIAPTVADGFVPWNYGLGLRLWSDGSWGHTGTIEHAKGLVIARPDGWSVVILDNGNTPAQTDELVGIVGQALQAMVTGG